MSARLQTRLEKRHHFDPVSYGKAFAMDSWIAWASLKVDSHTSKSSSCGLLLPSPPLRPQLRDFIGVGVKVAETACGGKCFAGLAGGFCDSLTTISDLRRRNWLPSNTFFRGVGRRTPLVNNSR